MPPHLDDAKTRACTLKTMSKERLRAEVVHNRGLGSSGRGPIGTEDPQRAHA